MVLLTVTPVIIYSNSFQAPFLFDDIPNIINEPSVQMTSLSAESLKRAAFEGRLTRRWLPNLSYGLNYYLGGHQVWGYHLLNLVVHIMTAMVFYGLSFTTLTLPILNFSRKSAAEISLIAAMAWASHPLQTNAVTYIVQRMSSMATFFYLASLLFYAKGRLTNHLKSGRYFFWGISIVSGVLALGCKENSAMLPLLILAYEFYFFYGQKQQTTIFRKRAAVLAVSLLSIFGVLAWFYLGNDPLSTILNGYLRRDFTLVERLLTETRIIIHYLSLIGLPLPSRLSLDYYYAVSTSLFSPPPTLAATLAVTFLTWLTVRLFHRHRLLSFCLLWFLANLFIESTVIPLELIFEHRLYLPSSMLLLSVVVLTYEPWERRRQALPFIWFGIIIVLCLFTWQRNTVWNSELSLWQDTVEKNPENARAIDSLASAYLERGDIDRAIKHYKDALNLAPSRYKSYDNLGIAYHDKSLFDEAINAFQKAIDIKPSFSRAHFNLGIAYYSKGLKEQAIEEFKEAVKTKPSYFKAYFAMGTAYHDKGHLDEAIDAFRKAVAITPDSHKAYFKLGKIYLTRRQNDEAISSFKKVAALTPSNPQVYFKLGIAYFRKNLTDEAITAFKKAIDRNPSYSKAYFNLGVIYSDKGLLDEAITAFKKAIAINPYYSRAYANLRRAEARKEDLRRKR